MVKGRAGLYLEAWKFGVYITVPIFASVYYSNPETQKYWSEYYQFVKYPENPNTNVKEQIEQLIQEKKLQKEQSQQYRDQLQQLQAAASRSKQYRSEPPPDGDHDSASWWRRVGRWVTGRSDHSSDS